MHYFRSPYVSNVTCKNRRESGEHYAPLDLQNLADQLEHETDVFEIGFNMGENLNYLRNSGVDVLGGVEFDPMFGTYGNKHFGLYENYKIILTNLDDWFKGEKVMFTFHWLENFSESDRQILLERIKANCDKVYFVENFIIDGAESVLGVQVYDSSSNRVEVDDRPADSESEPESNDSDES